MHIIQVHILWNLLINWWLIFIFKIQFKGYAIDENQVHYIVLHGIIETNPDQDAYSTITITQDRLIVEGNGSEQSLNLPLKNVKTVNLDDDLMETNDISETSETNRDKFKDYDEYEEQLAASSCVEVSV